MNIKIIIAITLSIVSINTYAGFNGLTIHSRANCLTINESISWDATKSHVLSVNTTHSKISYTRGILNYHSIPESKNGTWVTTWRNAVIHIPERPESGTYWLVHGDHKEKINGVEKNLGCTEASNCNIYDGWWDKDHPERKS